MEYKQRCWALMDRNGLWVRYGEKPTKRLTHDLCFSTRQECLDEYPEEDGDKPVRVDVTMEVADG